jgi:membrane fusion protein, multidrug efflux system
MKTSVAVLFLSVFWLAGCSEAPSNGPEAAPSAALRVTVERAAMQSLPSTYEATGTVRARVSTVISSKLMAYVREVKVQLGDRVREGQTLVTLDSRDQDVNARRAEAAREELRQAVPEADSAVAAAKANFDLAQSTFQRMNELFSKKSISDQEFDEATGKRKAAQANYEMMQARRRQLDSKMAQIEEDIRTAEVARSYTEITAPFAGLVTAKTVEPGILAAPGVPLLTLERDGAYRLEASVEESHLAAIHVGQPVRVELDGVDRTLEARVSEIVPVVDAASRAYTVKIDLPALPVVRSGSFGRALFQIGSRSILTIPASAVTERGQLRSVLVAENGVARTRLITLGQHAGDRVEVLSGLQPGDAVVISAPRDIADGSRIEVQP